MPESWKRISWFLWLWVTSSALISASTSRVTAFSSSYPLLRRRHHPRHPIPDSPFRSVMELSSQNKNTFSDLQDSMNKSTVSTTAQSFETPVKLAPPSEQAVESPTDVRAFPSLEEEEEEAPQNKDEMTRPFPVSDFRSQVLRLPSPMAQICSILAASPSTTSDTDTDSLVDPLARTFHELLQLATLSEITLRRAIDQKMALNRKKYPVEMCKGKAGKYTEYSSATGITISHGQDIDDTTSPVQTNNKSSDQNRLADESWSNDQIASWWFPCLQTVQTFRDERDWKKYHRPRSLALAAMGELGEVAEILQFEREDTTEISVAQWEEILKEMADVTIYCMSMTLTLGEDTEDFAQRVLGRIMELQATESAN